MVFVGVTGGIVVVVGGGSSRTDVRWWEQVVHIAIRPELGPTHTRKPLNT